MNTAESILYPSFYFRDMAFFLTKFVTDRFERNSSPFQDDSLSYNLIPPTLSACSSSCSSGSTDSLLITTALNNDFSSKWEERIYDVILRTLQLSEFDESVVVGTAVLLDMMRDMAINSQRRRAQGSMEDPILNLPAFPHEDYFKFFVGAYIHAYHLLSDNSEMISPQRWSEITGGMLSGEQVLEVEIDFREMLEKHMSSYEAPSYNNIVDGIETIYVQDEVTSVPPNPFISEDRYLNTKSTMFTHIRLAMTIRGQRPHVPDTVFCDDDSTVLDYSLTFSPCESEMKFRRVMLNIAKDQYEEINSASDRKAYSWIMGNTDRTDEETDSWIFSSMELGKGVSGLRRLENTYVQKVTKTFKTFGDNDWTVI
ncbi:hypothetical protein CPB83DRAFT_898841 [Crepidotus variabilis]|uniref:Uncharacterized protein n=1 Tax=Crepidotus variabilis TaxID=179855 RepID=A0A9P6E6N9_9AGAR|nr:hypothetical protein CPB83DRAFT_898841 [Crepidotus variabilis]